MDAGDRALLKRFESCEISLEDWNQRLHVAIAFLYLREFGPAEALTRMRSGVRKINARHGVEESQFSGYNETTTVAFLRIVEAVRLAYEDTFPAATAEEFCDLHPELMSKHLLRLFYSPKRRSHPEAKTRFVEPDLAPLPRVADTAS